MDQNMIQDNHCHSTFSDGLSSVKENAEYARKHNIDLCETDHYTIKKLFEDNTDFAMDENNVQRYIDEVKANKLRLGFEFDFVAREIDAIMYKVKELRKMCDVDVMIGSIHSFGNNLMFDNNKEKFVSEIEKFENIAEMQKKYFSLIESMAKSRMFDVVGHLDYIKRFNAMAAGKRELFDYDDEFFSLAEHALKIIAKNKMVVEVNTHGLKAPCAEQYVGERLMEVCVSEEIPVCLGSDAHHYLEIGAYFDDMLRILRRLGLKELVVLYNGEIGSVRI